MTNRFHRLELDTKSEQSADTTQSSSSNIHLQGDLHDSAHWMRMAGQNRRRGQFEEALRHYSRSVELDRSLVAGWVGQVQMLIALAEYPEAELWARKALELFRNHAELLAARAHALCRNGDLTQAQGVCDLAIAQPGQSEYCWIARGDLMLARRDQVEQHCFDKAVQLNPDWLVLIEIAAIYTFYHRHAKALERCRQAVEKAPDQAYCWYQQGRCQRAVGLNQPAALSFKQCLDLEPKHSEARIQLKELAAGGQSAIGLLRRLFGRG